MILTVAVLALGIHHAGAQYVTYNHDETKMNQVTVMETGAGHGHGDRCGVAHPRPVLQSHP